jgi:hypothetical protein
VTALLLALFINPPGGPPALGIRPFPAPRPEARIVTPPPVVVYQQADATGKVWTHSDPVWLRQWVDSVNARLIRPASVPWYPARTYCPDGRCPR